MDTRAGIRSLQLRLVIHGLFDKLENTLKLLVEFILNKIFKLYNLINFVLLILLFACEVSIKIIIHKFLNLLHLSIVEVFVVILEPLNNFLVLLLTIDEIDYFFFRIEMFQSCFEGKLMVYTLVILVYLVKFFSFNIIIGVYLDVSTNFHDKLMVKTPHVIFFS